MPNWIEGTLKLRGNQEDIKRFIAEGLEPCCDIFDKPLYKYEDAVTNEGDEDDCYYRFSEEMYVKDSRRAFILPGYVEVVTNPGIAVFNIKQAWDFVDPDGTVNRWAALSTKYNVDVRLFGIEMGAQFCKEIIIIQGKETKINQTEYVDWDWECPFPGMGG